LLLLHLVTAKYGKQETQLEYLQDPYLGPESIIAKGEWSLWRSKLQLMTQAEQWQELFQLTGSLLKRARTKNASGQITESRYSDWVVWEAYIKSALELSQKESVIYHPFLSVAD
jgi:N-terminal acetyltransferase B complex non-catalytic subunit